MKNRDLYFPSKFYTIRRQMSHFSFLKVLFLSVLFGFGCNVNKRITSNLAIDYADHPDIYLPENVKFHSIQYLRRYEDGFIGLGMINKDTICFYFFNKAMDSVKAFVSFAHHSDGFVWNATYINQDLIMKHFNPYTDGFNHDQSRQMVNGQNEGQYFYSIKGSLLRGRTQKPEIMNRHYTSLEISFPVVYFPSDSGTLFSIHNFRKLDKIYNPDTLPYSLLGLSYPTISRDTFIYQHYPQMESYFFDFDSISDSDDQRAVVGLHGYQLDENKVLIGNRFTDEMGLYDHQLKKVLPFGSPASRFMPIEQERIKTWKHHPWEYRFAQVSNLHFFTANNDSLLLRFHRIPFDSMWMSQEKYPVVSMSIHDHNNTWIGEFLMPNGTHTGAVVQLEDKSFIAYNLYASLKQNKFVFQRFRLVESQEPFDKNAQIESKKAELKQLNEVLLSEKAHENYFKYFNLSLTKDSNLVLLLPLVNSCYTCVKDLVPIIKGLIKSETKEISVILISPNQLYSERFLTENKIPKDELLKLDDNGWYRYYFADWVNPRLLTVNQNGEIIRDKTHTFSEMEDLKKTLVDLIERQNKKP